jgi:putative FmdB family regulatory protein
MPIYEYECAKCGKTIEVLQKVNGPAPECHGPMTRLISQNSFILKGTGWFKDSYQKRGKKPKNT